MMDGMLKNMKAFKDDLALAGLPFQKKSLHAVVRCFPPTTRTKAKTRIIFKPSLPIKNRQSWLKIA
jgi:hypothetical protein